MFQRADKALRHDPQRSPQQHRADGNGNGNGATVEAIDRFSTLTSDAACDGPGQAVSSCGP